MNKICCDSTRVSNELGAGRPDQARSAMLFRLKDSDTISGPAFSDGCAMTKPFASMAPLLLVSIVLDSIQGVLSGVARGCGWQHIFVVVNLATFYFVGMTVASLLAFKLKLYVKGLWIGLICGLSCQAATLLMISICKKWTTLQLSVNREYEDPILP
ncbi:hypothetical protein PanWU01x14_300190 [Parasponia andersonii]|uniref:Multi antimicrobial extrusion protein n=1 Tax=Parasponia andersonii TaxID=3476 RepID=A0A2P5AU53_PARAD|nr:hypothetical protein PanWU01x14_300190 [Parasponia andersonii]